MPARASSTALFRFVQLELPGDLGTGEARYVVREPGGAQGETPLVLILRTLGAQRRHLLRGRKPKRVEGEQIEPAPVPITRATLVDGQEMADEEEARRWLEQAVGDDDRREELVAAALVVLNLALAAHETARSPLRQLSRRDPSAIRLGYGDGDELTNGVHREAIELPDRPPRRGRLDATPSQERVAALLGGREVPTDQLEPAREAFAACQRAFRRPAR